MDQPRMPTRLAVSILIWLAAATTGSAQTLRRATIWDLKLGEPVAAQPATEEYRGFACGSNGGAPRAQLKGWSDFARCPAEPDGLREVYFEYDDELEYIARAKDIDREITRWAGTTEVAFPVVTSALFDDGGALRGIRLVTDSRPDHRNDITEANLRKRDEAYLFGSIMASRFNIDGERDCKASPPAEGESAVGTLFIKRTCEIKDPANRRRIVLKVNLFRKPGQSATNPQLPTQLTEGQFESSARIDIYQDR
jgi:hypothetical protein